VEKLVKEGRESEWRNKNVPPGMVYKPWSIGELQVLREKGYVEFQ